LNNAHHARSDDAKLYFDTDVLAIFDDPEFCHDSRCPWNTSLDLFTTVAVTCQ